jgi:hypothetical protein
MFISVKNLTTIIDNELQFIKEAYENKDNFSESEFNSYIDKMKCSLQLKYKKLVFISSNDRLLSKYNEKINKAFL